MVTPHPEKPQDESMVTGKSDREFGDRRETRNIIFLAEKTLGPERVLDIKKSYEYVVNQVRVVTDLRQRDSARTMGKIAEQIAQGIELAGHNQKARQTEETTRELQTALLQYFDEPNVNVPLLAKAWLSILSADYYYKLDAPSSMIDGFVRAINKVGRANRDIQLVLLGVFAARWMRQYQNTSIHELLYDLNLDPANAQIAESIVAINTVAVLFADLIDRDELDMQVATQTVTSSDAEATRKYESHSGFAYPESTILLAEFHIPTPQKFKDGINIGVPKPNGDYIKQLLPLKIGSEGPFLYAAEDRRRVRQYTFFEVPPLDWQPNRESETHGIDSLTLVLSIDLARRLAYRFQEVRKNLDAEGGWQTDPMAYYVELRNRLLSMFDKHWNKVIEEAIQPSGKVRKVWNVETQQKVDIEYSWLIQAFEQSYGREYLLNLLSSGSWPAVETEILDQLYNRLWSLILVVD
jgi:hypothetical protein